MRNEKGYFCSVEIVSSPHAEEIWYGPQRSRALQGQSFENIATNGVVLFPTGEEAESALQQLDNRPHFTKPTIGYMELALPESNQDIDQVKQGGNIILVNTTDGPTSDLLGPNLSYDNESSLYPLLSERLTINGGVAYSRYPDAVAHHDGRQGGKITVATLVEFRKPVQRGEYYQLRLTMD